MPKCIYCSKCELGLMDFLVNIKTISELVSLQTVLESRDHVHGPVGDDDFELWDQSQMLRAHQQRNVYKLNNGGMFCKPSCIPILFILILIILVVLLPLLDSQHDKFSAKFNNSLVGTFCSDQCRYLQIWNTFFL